MVVYFRVEFERELPAGPQRCITFGWVTTQGDFVTIILLMLLHSPLRGKNCPNKHDHIKSSFHHSTKRSRDLRPGSLSVATYGDSPTCEGPLCVVVAAIRNCLVVVFLSDTEMVSLENCLSKRSMTWINNIYISTFLGRPGTTEFGRLDLSRIRTLLLGGGSLTGPLCSLCSLTGPLCSLTGPLVNGPVRLPGTVYYSSQACPISRGQENFLNS